MARFFQPGLVAARRQTLPGCIAALLAVNSVGGDAFASPTYGNVRPDPSTVETVINCDDSGPGSLREAVANAVNGGVIDLTQLACSEITLFSGKISVTTASDLTLLGPGTGPGASHHLTIYGWYDRILDHGTGTLIVSGLELTYGHYQGVLARGGCIFSHGSLVIDDSIVSGCEVDAPFGSNAFAAGGAVYAQGTLSLTNTVIRNSVAYSATHEAYGGGVFASDLVTIESSTVAGNKVVAPQASAIGGGLMVGGFGDVTITSSTVSGNEAELAGGIRSQTLGTLQFINSTLSNNYASGYIGAAFVTSGPVKLLNSTVTRNSAFGYSAAIYSDQVVTAQSSIVADNRDVSIGLTFDICAAAIGGGANLITASCNGTPPDTLTKCPRLAPLGDHGGPTPTHALLAGSPGIDAGNDTLSLVTDQRGVPYPRVIGAKADIGAYEWQGERGDDIFKSAFEIACDEY